MRNEHLKLKHKNHEYFLNFVANKGSGKIMLLFPLLFSCNAFWLFFTYFKQFFARNGRGPFAVPVLDLMKLCLFYGKRAF